MGNNKLSLILKLTIGWEAINADYIKFTPPKYKGPSIDRKVETDDY